MIRIWLILILFLVLAGPAAASVEIAPEGSRPVTIDEVYWQDGTFFIAIEDVLPVFGVQGQWNSVRHTYHFSVPAGEAVISPGSQFIRINDRFLPLSQRPRFLDNRLRVPEDFVTKRLPGLLNTPIYYRNISPRQKPPMEDESTLDRLFAFLLQKKKPLDSPALRAVVIDPGHGGLDTGTLGLEAAKEKKVVLETALQLQKIIKMRLGIPVYLSRDDDYELTPQQRIEPATREEVDALIILHAQSSWRPSVEGITMAVRQREEYGDQEIVADQGESLRLARNLEKSFDQAGFITKGIYQAPLLPLRRGNLPTVLIEMGYLSNPSDHARLVSEEGQEAMARAIFAGLQSFAEEQKEKKL